MTAGTLERRRRLPVAIDAADWVQGDYQQFSNVTTTGTDGNLTLPAGSNLSQLDVGKLATVCTFTGGVANFFYGTVTAVADATHATISTTVTVALTTASFSIGTDAGPGLQAVLNYAGASVDEKIVDLRGGNYLIASHVDIPFGVQLRGQQPTSVYLYNGSTYMRTAGNSAFALLGQAGISGVSFNPSNSLNFSDVAALADCIQVQGRSNRIYSCNFNNYGGGWGVFIRDGVACSNTVIYGLTANSNTAAGNGIIRTPDNTTVNGTTVFNNQHVIASCSLINSPTGTWVIRVDGTHDLMVENVVTGGKSGGLHVRGDAQGAQFSGLDCGCSLTIEGHGAFSPNGLSFSACVFAGLYSSGGQTQWHTISNGTNINFTACTFTGSDAAHGLNITGGDYISFVACNWNRNNAAGTAARPVYDLNVASTVHCHILGCNFTTASGSSGATVDHSVNCGATANLTYFIGSLAVAGFASAPIQQWRTDTGLLQVSGAGSFLGLQSRSADAAPTWGFYANANIFRLFNGSDQIQFDQGGHILSQKGVPTAAAGANAGTAPPAPTTAGNDLAHTITWGTGTSPAAGAMASVTFKTAYAATPRIVITPNNSATVALHPYISAKSATGYTISFGIAPAASQGNTVYSVDVMTIG